MARELWAQHATGATLYAVLLNAAGAVWNGASFDATPTAVEWATYDIALTEDDVLGYFVGDMPAVVAGVYTYRVHKQIAGAPATTDPVVWIGEGQWTGAGWTVLGAPAGASIAADIAAVKGDAEGVVAATDTLEASAAAIAAATDTLEASAASLASAVAAVPTTGEIDAALSAAHGTGSWGAESLYGAGAVTHVVTILQGGLPVDDVAVWVTSDLAGVDTGTVVAGTIRTNASGVATFYLDASTWYWLHASKSGYNFTATRFQAAAS